jgi:hypothetical protein
MNRSFIRKALTTTLAVARLGPDLDSPEKLKQSPKAERLLFDDEFTCCLSMI